MKSTLIFSENIHLAEQLISLANSLSNSTEAVCLCMDDAAVLAKYPVQGIHVLLGSSSRPEDYAEALADLSKKEDAGLLLIGDTISGRELAAKTAAILDAGFVSGASQVEQIGGVIVTSRLQYGGAINKREEIQSLTVITVPAGKYPIPASVENQISITKHEVEILSRIRQLDLAQIERHGVSLEKSKTVIGVGLGFNQQQDLNLAVDLANATNGVVGCTRPIADDKKWLPNEQYIGISGAVIHPELYIAIGISGQIQHTVGVRDAKVIVGINNNEKAPIFKAVDYGIVGDLYEILPELTKAILAARSK